MANDEMLLKALRKAHAAGDTNGAARIAGMIKAGRAAASEASPPTSAPSTAGYERSLGERAARQTFAAIAGVGQGAFGLGDLAGGVGQEIGSAIRGETLPSFSEAVGRARKLREDAQKDYPLTSGVGEIGGALATGGAITRVAPNLALRAGQAVAGKIARLAGTGAAEAGITAAFKGEDVPLASVEGGVAGPVAAGVVKGVVKAGRAVRGLTERGSSDNAIRYLSDKLGESPDELRTAMDDFRRATGAPPSLAEITSAGSAAELRRVAEAKQPAGDVMREGASRITAARPGRMQRQIESRGPTDTLNNLVNTRNATMDSNMRRIENVTFRVPYQEVLQYADPDSLRPLNRDLRSRILQAVTNREPLHLTVRDADNMRQAFADTGDTGQKHMYFELSRNISNTASRAVPSYGSALAEYQAYSRGIKGFQHGQQSKLPADLKEQIDIDDAQTPEYVAGRNVGVRTRLGREAGESERKAVATADDLRQSAGTARELRGAIGPRETAALQAQGAAEQRGAERLADATPGARAPSEELANNLRAGVEAVAAAGGHTLTGFKTGVAARLVTRINVSERTARKIAENAIDPARLPGVIDALRRARLRDDEIRAILSPTAAAGGTVAEEVGQ